MHGSRYFCLAVVLLHGASSAPNHQQTPLQDGITQRPDGRRPLHGRFLHVTGKDRFM